MGEFITEQSVELAKCVIMMAVAFGVGAFVFGRRRRD